jgi:integrase
VSDDQFLAVLEKLPEPYRPVARLLLATGMRKGEALGLRWGEIRGESLFLPRTKSGKPREVPLTPETAALLPSRPADAADGELVFVGRDGGELRNNFDRAWRAAREAAEADRKKAKESAERCALAWIRVHDLRHEAASRYVEAGGTSRELMDLFGWSNLKVAARYAKSDQDRIRETLRRVHLPSAECTRSAREKGAEVRAFAK